MTSQARNASKRVLVVDDSPTVRTLLKRLLEPDYACLEAVDGLEGITRAVHEQPDAIITDLEMPVVDGLRLLKSLHEDERVRHIPVLVATSGASLEKVNACRALGCNGFVLKPLERSYLLAKLNWLLSPVRLARAG